MTIQAINKLSKMKKTHAIALIIISIFAVVGMFVAGTYFIQTFWNMIRDVIINNRELEFKEAFAIFVLLAFLKSI